MLKDKFRDPGMVFNSCFYEPIDELTMALFEDADVNKTGVLTYDALKGQLQKHEGLLENLSIRYSIESLKRSL